MSKAKPNAKKSSRAPAQSRSTSAKSEQPLAAQGMKAASPVTAASHEKAAQRNAESADASKATATVNMSKTESTSKASADASKVDAGKVDAGKVADVSKATDTSKTTNSKTTNSKTTDTSKATASASKATPNKAAMETRKAVPTPERLEQPAANAQQLQPDARQAAAQAEQIVADIEQAMEKTDRVLAQAEQAAAESIESNAAATRADAPLPPAKPQESTPRRSIPAPPDLDGVTKAMVLQGGGAKGAYQAGVFEAIHDKFHDIDWVAGVSIGAINGALIAGNPPEKRLQALREFWRLVSSAPGQLVPRWGGDEQLLAEASAGCAMLFGIPGLFNPRPSPLWVWGMDAPLTGIYDTEPMRETLLRLVDFDLINRGDVRFSVGAVNVRTGNSIYFDNRFQTITPEHVMASAALPPGLPPVHIDGDDYWDGGILSNTPLQYVLDNQSHELPLMVLQVDLYSANGHMPTTIGESLARQKDIQFSSRTRQNSNAMETQLNMAAALGRLLDRLPSALQQDPEVMDLRNMLERKPVEIVHLIYRSQRAFSGADFEFSRAAMNAHWEAGLRDMNHTLAHPDLLLVNHEQGVTTYDLADDAHQLVRHRLNARAMAKSKAV